MEAVLKILILGILAVLGIQDVRERLVSFWALISLFILTFGLRLLEDPLSRSLSISGLNAAFSIIILVLGTLLVRFRQKKAIGNYFAGAGDYLFLFAISPLFCFESYLVFMNLSFLLLLIAFGIYKKTPSGNKTRTIPLAGGMAFFLGILMILELVLKVHIINENTWLYQL